MSMLLIRQVKRIEGEYQPGSAFWLETKFWRKLWKKGKHVDRQINPAIFAVKLLTPNLRRNNIFNRTEEWITALKVGWDRFRWKTSFKKKWLHNWCIISV